MAHYEDVQIPLLNASRRGPHYRVAHAYVPDAITTTAYTPTPDTADALAMAGEAIARAEALASRSEASLTQLSGLLSRSEGIGSSTIEGYRAPLEKVVVAAAMNPRPFSNTTAGIIRDGIEAVQFALDELGGPDPITPASIEAVQLRLMGNQGAYLHGYRTTLVQIGGDPTNPDSAAFVPPPHGHVPRLMDDLCAFINADSAMHPIARAAITHAQFETIHPFPDGNGRTGRALMQAMLRRAGLMEQTVLPLSAVIAHDGRSREAYIRALGGVRGGSLDDTVATFAAFVRDGAYRTEALVAEVDDIVSRLRDQASHEFRSDSSAQRMIDLLITNVGVTAPAAAAALGVSAQAVQETLKRMTALGMVDSRAGGKGGRVHYAPDVLAVIARASDSRLSAHEMDAPMKQLDRPSALSTLTGVGAGRPSSGPRCGKPLRGGGTCQRPRGHADTGHRSTP